MLAGRVQKGAEPGAGGHKHKRTLRSAPQGMQAAVWGWSVGVQGSRITARVGVTVERSCGSSGGSVVVWPLQVVHVGYPSGPPALFGVHITEEGTQWWRGMLQGEGLQLCEGCVNPGFGFWSTGLPALHRTLPEQHHNSSDMQRDLDLLSNLQGGGVETSAPPSLFASLMLFPLKPDSQLEGSPIVPLLPSMPLVSAH